MRGGKLGGASSELLDVRAPDAGRPVEESAKESV